MAIMAACSSENRIDDGDDPLQLVPITTHASIGDIVVTKAGDPCVLPTQPMDVTFFRDDSLLNFRDIEGRIEATINTDGTVVFNPTQYYQADGAKTRMFGWYPRVGGIDEQTTDFEIDGKTDILISEPEYGDKYTQEIDQFNFKHKLTKIDIEALADNDGVSQTWGKIIDIFVKSTSSSCTIDFPDNSLDFDHVVRDLPVELTETAADDPGKPSKFCGSVMIAPFEGNLEIMIITERAAKTITLVEEFDAGYAYKILLNFTATEINPVACIEAWDYDDNDDLSIDVH